MCVFFEVPLCSTSCFDKAKEITEKKYSEMNKDLMFLYDIAYVGF